MSINGNCLLSMLVSLTERNALDLANVDNVINKAYKTVLTNGTGDNQVNKVWSDQRTLAASTTEDLDLAASLTDAFGNAITFATIKAIIVSAASGNTNNVLVGGAASNQFINWVSDASDKIVVKPGGLFVLVAPKTGYAVTASTGDLLRIGNSSSGSSVTYDIFLMGTI